MGWFEQSCADNPVGLCKRCCAVGETFAVYLDIAPNSIVLTPGGKRADHYPVLWMNLCKDCLKELDKWIDDWCGEDSIKTESDMKMGDECNQELLNKLNKIREEVDEIYGMMCGGGKII